MSVYVDPNMRCQTTPEWTFKTVCHLTADSEDQLHKFASMLGLRREWFQHGSVKRLPHYDLTSGRRRVAVELGAIQITRNEMAKRVIVHRKSFSKTSAAGSNPPES